MKQKKFRFILFLIVISSFLILPFNPIVNGVPTNWVYIDDFDTFTAGDTSGTNDEFEFERVTGDFRIVGTTDNYLRINGVSGSGDELGYLNVTDTGHYGYWMKFKSFQVGSSEIKFSWMNQSLNSVVTIRFQSSIILYYDWEDNWQTLSYISSSTIYYIYWNWYSENLICYRLYNSALTLIAEEIGTGRISGDDSDGQETFNCSICKIYEYGSYTNPMYCYLYGYNEEILYGEDALPSVDGALIYLNGQAGVFDICLGTTVRVDIESFGDEERSMCINITDNNGDYVFSGCTLEEVYTMYMTFEQEGTYTIGIIDAFHPSGYNTTIDLTVVDCGQFDYLEYYGNFYAEFYTDFSSCYYMDGDFLAVSYNLNDSVNYSSEGGRYYIDIYSSYPLGEERVYTIIDYNGSYEDRFETSVQVSNMITYQIIVFNASYSNGAYSRDEIIYESQIIKPCRDSDGDGIPDSSDDDPYNYNGDDTEITDYQIMLGFFISLGIGIGLAYITGELLVLFLASAGCFYLFSSSMLGDMQLLPESVGVGLIVLFVIIGVIVWFLGK